ncbi:MAG: sulfide/dihydroorotate dehydrogenase-like FAD/NAD-binding protein [Alphaproteobacteria bacterium]|jgi:ferredoxin--NADP+ reductase|nr:sulfide/dihydroorotate dehydrogenase-like FAD/NAD-binding protein [Alphaproteobacteria bacterium]MDP6818959.1 sulfide/dihydroorotate dehydrogenase-like FAD/NAD-binding protein [Alphaproteobacteria bacterium]
MARIISKRILTPLTKLFVIDAPLIAAAVRPGQFVIVRVREDGERIPLTIADFDRERGEIIIVVQEVGVTTRLLGALEEGDDILDVAGPMGAAPEIAPGGHTVGVGGGFGAAALLCLMRDLHQRGEQTTVIIGARNKELLILTDELSAACGHLELCTDDGSSGFKGFVTGRLQQLIDGDGGGLPPPDRVLAIGPMPMMRAVAETTRSAGIETLASMDPLMIDGTGMCGGCRVTVGDEVKFACVDGPFFDAHQVDFDEAVRRNKMYADMESQAAERQARALQAAAGTT